MNRNFTHMSNLFHNNKDSSGNIFDGWSYDKENYILFGAGIITIILGFIIKSVLPRYIKKTIKEITNETRTLTTNLFIFM